MSPKPIRNAVPTDKEIYDRIFSAILEHRLAPGAHLREIELASMFGVGRTKDARRSPSWPRFGIVVVERNRGATVAAPSRRQAGQVFDLRTMLEPAIAARLAERRTKAQLDVLRQHIAREESARAKGDEAALIRLTGEFHLILAGQLGNPLVDRVLRGLEALTVRRS